MLPQHTAHCPGPFCSLKGSLHSPRPRLFPLGCCGAGLGSWSLLPPLRGQQSCVCPCVHVCVSVCPWAGRNRSLLFTLPLPDLSPKGPVMVSSLPTNTERWFEEKKQSALETNSSNSWLYILCYCGSSCPSRGRVEHGPVPVSLCRSRRWLLGVCSEKSRAWPQQALGDQGDSSLSAVWGLYETWLNSTGTRSAGELPLCLWSS